MTSSAPRLGSVPTNVIAIGTTPRKSPRLSDVPVEAGVLNPGAGSPGTASPAPASLRRAALVMPVQYPGRLTSQTSGYGAVMGVRLVPVGSNDGRAVQRPR